MSEGTSINLYEFLSVFNRFRSEAIRSIEGLSREKVVQNKVVRLNDNFSLTPSLAHLELHLSLGVGVELEDGDLTWAVDARLTPEVTVVTANLRASYYDEPYQTLVRNLGGTELGAGVEGSQQLNLIVDELLDDLSRTLKSASLLELHRQSVNKPFFPNL